MDQAIHCVADNQLARSRREGSDKVCFLCRSEWKCGTETNIDRSNHGSFYYNQLAALQLIVDDKDGASKTIQEFFNGIYMGQIAANGDQVRVRFESGCNPNV